MVQLAAPYMKSLLSVFYVIQLLIFGILSGCAEPDVMVAEKPAVVAGFPAEVTGEQVKPGLAVLYFHDKYRHIKQIPKGKRIRKYAHPGPPILKLDHKFERGKVFDSGRSQGVGMLMNGFFHLEKPGTYLFQSNSNDGFRMFINDMMIIDDPTVHVDKLSEPGQFEVKEGGWFPVTLKYFQRKGTATLQLYWQPPGASEFSIVPESVYYHTPR